MGKRKRRLHSPKYARKYASVRETYNRLRGVIKEAEADGIITEEEVAQIELAKKEVIEAIIATNTEEIVEVVEEIEKEVDLVTERATSDAKEKVEEPEVKKTPKRRTSIKPRATRRKKKSTKTEG